MYDFTGKQILAHKVSITTAAEDKFAKSFLIFWTK